MQISARAVPHMATAEAGESATGLTHSAHRVAISSERFTDLVEKIAHTAREEAANKMSTEFDAASKAHSMGSILLAVERVRQNTMEVLDAAVAAATSYNRDFPGTSELVALIAGPARARATTKRGQRLFRCCQSRHHYRSRAAGVVVSL
jgi:hypothetical protein